MPQLAGCGRESQIQSAGRRAAAALAIITAPLNSGAGWKGGMAVAAATAARVMAPTRAFSEVLNPRSRT